jgi:hypothetical protein
MGNRRGRSLPAPPLTVEQILAWADAYHARTGFRPHMRAGTLALPAGESWHAISSALRVGGRGLPEGDTLRELLQRHRPNMDRGPRGRKRNQGQRARVAELRARGLSLAQIGAELGVSRQAVSAMLRRIGTAGFDKGGCHAATPSTRGHPRGNL